MDQGFTRSPTRHSLDCLARLDGLALVSRRMMMMTTTWIGKAFSVAWLLLAQSAVAAPAVGPREAVEAAVVRVLGIVQDGQAAGAPVADRSREIRRIAGEMFDFDEIARRALSQHWQALPPEEQALFVTLFRDILERSYIAQIEACGGARNTSSASRSRGTSLPYARRW